MKKTMMNLIPVLAAVLLSITFVSCGDGGGGGGNGGGNPRTAELEGTWHLHNLSISNTAAMWVRVVGNITSSGEMTIVNSINSDGDPVPETTLTMSVSSNGTVSMSNRLGYHGYLSTGGGLIGAIANVDSSGYSLDVMQQIDNSVTYSATDIQTDWYAFALVTNGPDSQWEFRDLIINGTGNPEFNSYLVNGTDISGSLPFDPADIEFTIQSSGIVNATYQTNDYGLHGFMSPSKDIIVTTTHTGAQGEGYQELSIWLLNDATTFSQADMTGPWKMHQVYAGNSGWTWGPLTIDNTGTIDATLYNSDGSSFDIPEDMGGGSMSLIMNTTTGELTFSGAYAPDSYKMFMGPNKDIVVDVEYDSGDGVHTITIIQK